MSMRRGQVVLVAMTCLLLCANTASASTDAGLEVMPPKPIAPAQFTDEAGNAVNFPASDTKWKIAFFGYTRCPDVCPMTMSKVSRVLGNIRAAAAEKLEVIFITVDGQRDKPGELKAYVRNFGADIRGLRGDAESTRVMAQQFGVTTRKFQGKTAMAYTLQHSVFLYLLDPDNRLRYMFSAGSDTGAIVSRINDLLAGTPSTSGALAQR